MNNDITINIEEILSMEDNSITDCESIRQIALLGYPKHNIPRDVLTLLHNKVNQHYTWMGLYPEVMTSFDILIPERYNGKPTTESNK